MSHCTAHILNLHRASANTYFPIPNPVRALPSCSCSSSTAAHRHRPSMAMLNHNLIRNNAAAAARLLRQAREDVSSALLGVGFLTCATAVNAAASRPAAESVLPYPVYRGALAGAFIGGLATMWAAGWVAGDDARRRATGRVILCASLVPMVVAVGLGNDSDLFFGILRALA